MTQVMKLCIDMRREIKIPIMGQLALLSRRILEGYCQLSNSYPFSFNILFYKPF